MDFEIKKNVRSAFMHPGDYEVWINGIGANRENFEDTRKGPDDYSQQFTGWTIGEDDLTPVKARIEEMVEAPRTEATDQIYTSFADIDKSVEMLGYKPTTNVDSGVGQFLNWYNNYHTE